MNTRFALLPVLAVLLAIAVTPVSAVEGFSFITICDPRPSNFSYPAGRDALTEDLDQIPNHLPDGWPFPEFVFYVGDIDLPSVTEEGYVNAIPAVAGLCHVFVVGNHEIAPTYCIQEVKDHYPTMVNTLPTGATVTMSSPTPTNDTMFMIEYQNTAFVTLDIYYNETTWVDTGVLYDRVMQFADTALGTTNKPVKFVFYHEPCFPDKRHVGDSLDADPVRRDEFWDLLVGHGVEATYVGHDHWSDMEEEVQGILEIDAGVSGLMVGGDNEPVPTLIYTLVTTGGLCLHRRAQPISGRDWAGGVNYTDVPSSPWATNPNPADGAEDVDINADLSWSPGAYAESHNVYFGTDPVNLPQVSEGQVETTYDPGTLTNEEMYYWRIDEFDGSTTHTGNVWSFTTAPVPGQASNPNPADSATNVAVEVDLSWTAGSDTTSHNVYFGDSDPPPFIQNQAGTTYDPGTLAPETTYYWQVDEVGPGGLTTGLVWSFTTESVPPATADSDIPVKGTVGGSYIDTQSSDDICETITETKSGGKPSSRYSMLEHKWTINVVGGGTITFYLEAYKTDNDDGDDFVFAYSTDDSTYTDMVTVTETYETVQNYVLPSSTAGTVYIRVTDTDQTAGNMSFDTISIDHMYISTGEPDTDPPAAPTGLTATSAGATQIDLDWADNTEPDLSHYSVWRSTTEGGSPDPYIEIASDVAGSDYSDTGLSPSMTYYYVVKAVDTSSNESGYSNEASATTSELVLPGQATDPTPSENQVDVNKNTVILSWMAGTDAASHDVYLGTSPDALLLVSEGQSGTIYDPGRLERQTTYHWRIDEVNAAGTTTGIVWSFTTR